MITAASGHGPQGGESEGEGGASGAMRVVAGSWLAVAAPTPTCTLTRRSWRGWLGWGARRDECEACEARGGPCESLSSGESLLLPSTRRRVVVGDDGTAGIGSVTRWMAI